jgi:AraC-like DNA-binding protein
MDPLSDLLRVVRLDGAYFFAVEAAEPWSIETVAARELTPRILPGAEHLISYHIIKRGRCYGGLLGEEPAALTTGDVILFPHGDAHIMSSEREMRLARAPHVAVTTSTRYADTVVLGRRGASTTSIVCGFLGCDRLPFNPLLAALPRRLHMRELGGLTASTAHLVDAARPGADTLITRLAEVLFIEVLRRYLDELPPSATGWLAGLRDPIVGGALGLIHGRPGHSWTLARLARETASSRTNLAERFTRLVGTPPMQYLTQWRMQVAANRLAESNAKIAAIGAEVGYDSEAAFSRAFKKAVGVAPGAFRTREQEARTNSHR